MGWESCDVVRFDFGPLLQDQMRTAQLKGAFAGLLLVLEVWDVKPTYWKSWATNLLMGPVVIFGPALFLEVWDVKPTYTFLNFSCLFEFG